MRIDHLIGFMAEALLLLIAAKLVRDVVLKWRGYDVNEILRTNKSAGVATSQAGYLVGVLLGFLGAITGRGEDASFLGIAGAVALAGVVAIVLQLVADFASDKLIFRGIAPTTGEKQGDKPGDVDDVNVALAVGKAAVSVATGLVLRGAMSDPEIHLPARIAWFAAAQAVMVLSVLFYCRLTPYDDIGEIKRNNLAAGFPIAGILLAVGLVMEAAVSAKSTGTVGQAALAAGKFLAISLVLVYVFRLITDFIMLRKIKLSQAIVNDRNVGAGIQEGVSFLLASLIVTFFLT